MVCINSNTKQHSTLKFTHFVNVPGSHTIIGTAREFVTRRTKVYLYSQLEGRIYRRNGLSGTWEEIFENREELVELVNESLNDNSIPRFNFSTN
jgi:hypothetical protein